MCVFSPRHNPLVIGIIRYRLLDEHFSALFSPLLSPPPSLGTITVFRPICALRLPKTVTKLSSFPSARNHLEKSLRRFQPPGGWGMMSTNLRCIAGSHYWRREQFERNVCHHSWPFNNALRSQFLSNLYSPLKDMIDFFIGKVYERHHRNETIFSQNKVCLIRFDLITDFISQLNNFVRIKTWSR